MQQIREILRRRLAAGLSIPRIRQTPKASVAAIQHLLPKAVMPGLISPPFSVFAPHNRNRFTKTIDTAFSAAVHMQQALR